MVYADNLYLDFNGIIHNCSHPPSSDGDAHFRLSEEAIFTSIFAYVDHVFSKIKPKKVFFLAVDGVAPRAKMNQQRGRRFRTAKEAKELREKAEKKGEVLPEQKAFDSNCITPGEYTFIKPKCPRERTRGYDGHPKISARVDLTFRMLISALRRNTHPRVHHICSHMLIYHRRNSIHDQTVHATSILCPQEDIRRLFLAVCYSHSVRSRSTRRRRT